MKIGFISNLRAPYRTLQLEEWSKIKGIKITAYYTDPPKENRKWNIEKNGDFKEKDLKGEHNKFNINNLVSIVKENDLLILGGYEKKEYIIISVISKIMNKKTVLLFDGISTPRIFEKENFFKKGIKKIVVSNSKFILGNGKVSEKYFNEQFDYPISRIRNQYLTVDIEKIQTISLEKVMLREKYRKKYKIGHDERVLMYSGRLIDIKNIESVIKALSKNKNKKITLFILGGGILEKEIERVSKDVGVRTIITGFIEDQNELFRQYSVGDAFILPSIKEPWGLVVNEAMAFGLPVIVSNVCGCSLDLVKEEYNGYLVNPYDVDEISEKIEKMFNKDNFFKFGYNSKLIIKDWTFKNSKLNLARLLDEL